MLSTLTIIVKTLTTKFIKLNALEPPRKKKFQGEKSYFSFVIEVVQVVVVVVDVVVYIDNNRHNADHKVHKIERVRTA